MITTAIIAEFNPFHNGHKYLFDQAKQITNADYLIVVMSGDFVQRGEPAIMDKYIRSEIALQAGADLVLELPISYATASAEFFAYGGVKLLNSLGCVDYVCFGSESGDLTDIQKAASILTIEPDDFKEALTEAIKAGCSYPAARKLAMATYFSDTAFLDSPNNILALEYCKALLTLNSTIKPITIKRAGSDYHEESLSTNETFVSATALRSTITKEDFTAFSDYMPTYGAALLQMHFQKRYPITLSDFDAMLQYKLMMENDFTKYVDVTTDLHDKICKLRSQYKDAVSFISLLKSKDLTYTRISRVLCHILLDIKKSTFNSIKEQDIQTYAYMLALNSNATALTSTIKETSKLMLISSPAKAEQTLTSTALIQFQLDVTASHLYESVLSTKFDTPMTLEYNRKMITK